MIDDVVILNAVLWEVHIGPWRWNMDAEYAIVASLEAVLENLYWKLEAQCLQHA